MNQSINLVVSASPHITKKGHTTRSIMLDVIIALTPAMIVSVLFFGHLVAINIVLCVAFCMGLELLYNMLVSKRWNKEGLKDNSAWDFSCIVTGIILALNLPIHITIFGAEWANKDGVMLFSLDMVFACFIGSLMAIVLVKMLFGGIGKNFANPAAVARIFLFLSFGIGFKTAGISSWIPNPATGATWLSAANQAAGQTSILQAFLGVTASAAVGETCAVAILAGYVYLSIKRVIDFRLPLMVVASAAVFYLLFKGVPDLLNSSAALKSFDAKQMLNDMLMHILSGGLIFGAVFMATDYSTSPNTFKGSIVFAAGIGLFTMLIRLFGSYPEGMSFAIVLMNILVPIIDKYIRLKPFGYAKNKSKSTVEAKNVSANTQTEVK